jgi:hypothetical protein
MELSDRTSAVMKSSVTDDLLISDPILSIFKMFGRLNDLEVQPALKVVPQDELSAVVADHADQNGSGMILIPWLPGTTENSVTSATEAAVSTPGSAHRNNPFDALLRATRPASAIHSHFVRGVFLNASVDVAVFVDLSPPHTTPQMTGKAHHLLLPFFGGPDDRLALEFVVHLCQSNPDVSATVVRYIKSEPEAMEQVRIPEQVLVKGEKPLAPPEMMTVSVSFFISCRRVHHLIFFPHHSSLTLCTGQQLLKCALCLKRRITCFGPGIHRSPEANRGHHQHPYILP